MDNGNPISGNSISIDIPNDYRVDGDSFEFTVTRGDGCSVTFPFIYQEEEERSGIYVSGDFYSSQFDIPSELEEAYIGTVTCESCTPIDQSQFAGNPEETDCFNNRNSAIKFFKWIPSDDSNPCNGGGELVFQVLDPRDGDFNSVVIPIGANQSLFEVSNAGIGNSQTVGFNCLTGGACVFSSSVVSSVFNLDRPVAGSFCLEQEDFNNGSGSEREICDFRILETGARPDISISLSHDLTTDNYIYLKRFLIGIGLDFTISGAVGGPHNYCGADLIPDQWPIVNPNEEINLFFSGLGCLEDMNGQPFGSTNIDLTFGCGTFVSAQETETRHSTELETDITEETTIVAYPNPSTNFITISYSGPYDKMDLEIFDPLGRSIEDTEILKGEEKEVLGDKAPGIYTVVFSNGDGFSKTQKLIRVD